MDSVITKYPIEILTDEKVEEIDFPITTGEENVGRVEAYASALLSHIETIESLREIGVSGEFSITWGDLRVTFPEK